MTFTKLGGNDALFTLKAFLSAIMAYYIALRIGLERPYWAIITSYIVAQPLAGACFLQSDFPAVRYGRGSTCGHRFSADLGQCP